MELRLCWITLIFTVSMISGSPAAASPVKTRQTPTLAKTTEAVPEYAFYLCIEVTNRIYNDSLKNQESAEYKAMYADVSGVLQVIYNCTGCGTYGYYRGVAEMTFSNGSVIANSTIVFQTVYINAVLVKSLFSYNLPADNTINGLKINRKYTQDVVTPVPAAVPTTGYTSTTPLPTTTRTTRPANTTTTQNATTATSKPPNNTTTSSAPNSTTTTHLNTTTSFPTTTKPASNISITSPSNTTKPVSNTTTSHISITSPSTPSNTTSHASNTSITSPSVPKNTTTPAPISNSTSNSTTKSRKTEAVKIPTTNPPVSAEGAHYYKVPGWAIALLVLACIILLLLIILLIITLIRWCCWVPEKYPEPEPLPPLPEQHTPYERKTFKEPLSTPSYSPQTPQKSPIPASPFEDPTRPRVNRTGMYVVNPES